MNVVNVFSSPNQFVLKGKTQGLTSGRAILSYMVFNVDQWKQIKDTSIIAQGNFLFKGKLEEPTKAELKINDKEISFYIEPATMELYIPKDNPNEFSLKGSKTQIDSELLIHNTQELNKLNVQLGKHIQLIYHQLDSLNKTNSIYEKLEKERESVSLQIDSISRLIAQKDIDFIQLKTNSYLPVIGHYLNFLIARKYLSVDSARILFDRMSRKIRFSTFGIRTNNEIKKRENVVIGKVAPDFNTLDMNGKMVKLSDFCGKNYVILDFWASWCGPCLKGVPHLKAMYSEYQNKGLKVICISMDNRKDKWLSAIDKYDLGLWYHVLCVQDLEKSMHGIENKDDIREKYPLGDGIPQYVLIDKTGKIIGKWDSYSEQNEKEQDQILSELFDK